MNNFKTILHFELSTVKYSGILCDLCPSVTSLEFGLSLKETGILEVQLSPNEQCRLFTFHATREQKPLLFFVYGRRRSLILYQMSVGKEKKGLKEIRRRIVKLGRISKGFRAPGLQGSGLKQEGLQGSKKRIPAV